MQVFFILSLGRAGTMTMSRILGEAVGARVHHEPWESDRQLLFYRYAGGFEQTLNDELQRRFDTLLPRDPAVTHYGESNSYLRYESDWLHSHLNAQTFFVVRDGREFVRSAYQRNVLTHADPQQPIIPKDGDPFASRWHHLSRFERLCWYWKHSNEMLLRHHDRPLKMESLLGDFKFFRESLLVPLGLELTETAWQRVIASPLNASAAPVGVTTLKSFAKRMIGQSRQPPRQVVPGWKNWNDEMTEQYWDICGDMMSRLGYT